MKSFVNRSFNVTNLEHLIQKKKHIHFPIIRFSCRGVRNWTPSKRLERFSWKFVAYWVGLRIRFFSKPLFIPFDSFVRQNNVCWDLFLNFILVLWFLHLNSSIPHKQLHRFQWNLLTYWVDLKIGQHLFFTPLLPLASCLSLWLRKGNSFYIVCYFLNSVVNNLKNKSIDSVSKYEYFFYIISLFT